MKKLPANSSVIYSQAGFTLLEVVVATTITVIMMIAATGLFLSTIRSNSKGTQVSEVKTEGDYALSQIEFLLRNAISVVQNPQSNTDPICENNMDSISFKEIDGGITTLGSVNSLIASKSATAATASYLTTPATVLSNLKFDCSQAGTNYGTYVTASFSLSKDDTAANTPTTLTQDFKTGVAIRSY